MLAHQIMSQQVITVGVDATVVDAINVMLTHGAEVRDILGEEQRRNRSCHRNEKSPDPGKDSARSLSSLPSCPRAIRCRSLSTYQPGKDGHAPL